MSPELNLHLCAQFLSYLNRTLFEFHLIRTSITSKRLLNKTIPGPKTFTEVMPVYVEEVIPASNLTLVTKK